MKLTKKQIEHIIAYEIEVDCYDEHEANMGWAIFMEENLHYPFKAEYLVRKKSGEKTWTKVMVVNSETDESSFDGSQFYVEIELNDMIISANIDKLRSIKADEKTMKTLQIWNYRNS